MAKSADLSVNYLGLSLKNPILVAAGPWSRDTAAIKKALAQGVGAVVTPSIVSEASPLQRPQLFHRNNQLGNIKLYSELSLEDWRRIIGEVKEAGGTLIASIMGQTPTEMAYLAEAVESFGADAIEIGAASPLGEGAELVCANPDRVFDYTSKVIGTVKIPVAVKLSATISDLTSVARAAEKAGAAAMVGIDAVRSFMGVDIRTQRPYLPTYGGLSGPTIKTIALGAVSIIAGEVKIPVCGAGGITTFEDALEFLMLGARAVQVGTSILTEGYENLGKIIHDLEDWMGKNHFTSPEEICGTARRHIYSFQDLHIDPLVAEMEVPCPEKDCYYCYNCCNYGAVIKKVGETIIVPEKCSGCGICVNLCPQSRISLNWK